MMKTFLFRIVGFCVCLCWNAVACAQFTIGTTGLMHLPTADMQRDKTFMFGGSWLDTHAIPNYHGYGWDREPTMNYYINITIFPWLEVSYDCTLIRGKYLAESRELPVEHFKKWANQDRNFSFRLRVWKEGWWKWWTPQIVVGANDALHTFKGDGTGQIGVADSGNGFWGRLYIAATKHIELNHVGTLGTHVAFMHNKRSDFRYRGLGV
ncbi:MAG: YjbH domain-containing protein, partial [Bacteroidaceae bacterium]|nr:YjbH domain-containing protein [Bacteroidaceae bacterium]